MSELPKGWEITTLGSLGIWSSGGTPSRKHTEYYGGSIPWVKTGDLQDSYIASTEEFLTDVGLKNSSAKLFPAGTLLLAMYGATIGRTGLLKIDAATNQACAALIADGLTKDLIPFLWWFLIHKADEFKSIGQGGAQPNISQTLIKQFPIALPPFNEQRRIIAKLDSLFARSRRAREELERIPKLCDRYKQAILAAACSGCLTADWRENKVADEKERGSFLANDVIPLYECRDIPESWYWETFGNLVINCDSRRVPVRAEDRAKRQGIYPYYGAFGIIDKIDDFLFDGTFLLVAEDGKNLESRQRPIAQIASGRFWVNNHAHVLQMKENMEYGYMSIYFNSPLLDLTPFLTGIDQIKLNRKAMDRISVVVPPLIEQREIVRRVEKLFKAIDVLWQEYQKANKLCDRLEQATLSKAFRGELVPQDPNDEPAAALLERILAENPTQTKGKSVKSKQRSGG